MKNKILIFNNRPAIISSAIAGGEKEYEGPLGDKFDHIDMSNKFGMDTWEQAENESQRIALNLAMAKAKKDQEEIDAVFAGDLINQCTGSAYGLLSFMRPYFGIYGACSTSALGLMMASMAVNAGYFNTCAAVTSSHFCSAERQFRFPLEYGSLRCATSQWTVTAGGAFIIGKDENAPYIYSAYPGTIVDGGINDANNMGAAMAPAVIHTLTNYFKISNTSPGDYDAIFTGDLGYEGYCIVKELMEKEGYIMGEGYRDCGLIIYDRISQQMNSGGSGCGCSASVLSAYILPRIELGEFKDVLYIATGALMSPTSLQQGLSIPGIAHLIRIKGK